MNNDDLLVSLNTLRVVDLRQECKGRNLRVGGTKAELIERLATFLKEKASKPESRSEEKQDLPDKAPVTEAPQGDVQLQNASSPYRLRTTPSRASRKSTGGTPSRRASSGILPSFNTSKLTPMITVKKQDQVVPKEEVEEAVRPSIVPIRLFADDEIQTESKFEPSPIKSPQVSSPIKSAIEREEVVDAANLSPTRLEPSSPIREQRVEIPKIANVSKLNWLSSIVGLLASVYALFICPPDVQHLDAYFSSNESLAFTVGAVMLIVCTLWIRKNWVTRQKAAKYSEAEQTLMNLREKRDELRQFIESKQQDLNNIEEDLKIELTPTKKQHLVEKQGILTSQLSQTRTLLPELELKIVQMENHFIQHQVVNAQSMLDTLSQ